MRRVINYLFLFLILIVFSQGAFALEEVKTYVHDEANVISQRYEDYLFYELELLRQNTSVEMVVVTVNTLNGVPIEEYSLNLAHEHIGDEEKDNGILILLAVDDQEYRIEVGYGLEGVINAPLAGRIGREIMQPHFQTANYEQGLLDGVIGIKYIIENDDSWETTGGVLAEPKNYRLVLILSLIGLWLFLSLMGFLASRKSRPSNESYFNAAAFAVWLMNNKGGRGGGGFGGGGFGGGGFGGGGFGGGGFSGKF